MFFKHTDEVYAMEKVKGFLVTGGKFLTVWDNDDPIEISSKQTSIKCMKYNFLTESLYIGCCDSSVIVTFI